MEDNVSPSAAIEPTEEAVLPSGTKLIRSWCERNDWIPDSKVLSHFTGLSVALFDLVRRTMIKEGWRFERTPDGHGWNVTKPESPEQKRLKELLEAAQAINAEITELQRKIGG